MTETLIEIIDLLSETKLKISQMAVDETSEIASTDKGVEDFINLVEATDQISSILDDFNKMLLEK